MNDSRRNKYIKLNHMPNSMDTETSHNEVSNQILKGGN
jgi:hypothetical protein